MLDMVKKVAQYALVSLIGRETKPGDMIQIECVKIADVRAIRVSISKGINNGKESDLVRSETWKWE